MRILHALTAMLVAAPLAGASAQLRGSERSMERQHRVAIRSDLSFLGTGSEVKQFVRSDRLVPVRSTRYLMVKDVSYAYARPQVATFLRQLSEDYFAAALEPLVVTSLVRPITEQPRNSSPLSVHPAGMAVDLRIPDTWEHRRWLENHLLALERRSVLDVTLEFHPAHYHVAVFPTEYMRYASSLSAVAPDRFSAARVIDKKRGPVGSHPPARSRGYPGAARAGVPARRVAVTPAHRGAAAPRTERTRRSRGRDVGAEWQRAATHGARLLKDTRAGRVLHPGARKHHPHSARKATTGSSRAARAAG
jgi:hypothetical protein